MSASVGRRFFLASAAASAVAAAASPASAAGVASPAGVDTYDFQRRDGRRALVFSGGGALGAYEAGIVAALADRQGLRDGMPLPYDLVCGTSIGALNAYCVATAQYSRLKWAWNAIPTMNVIRLKPKYQKIRDQNSGVLTRLSQALGLGVGLIKNVRGILDSSSIAQFFETFVQPNDPVHVPFYFASTNLTRLRGEIFVRRATTPAGLEKQRMNDQLLAKFERVLIRDAGDDLIRQALFASAAIPLAIDPVTITSLEGTMDDYVDGGVTYNVPVNIARRCAEAISVVLVDPVFNPSGVTYRDAVQIGLGVFETMQHSLLEYQVRLAYTESYVFESLGGAFNGITDPKAKLSRIPLTVEILRPKTALQGSMLSFNDPATVQEIWQRGYADGTAGFVPYSPLDQLLS